MKTMEYKNGGEPQVGDVVRGKGLNRTGVVVATVVGVVTQGGVETKLHLAVQRRVPSPVVGSTLRSAVLYCEDPLDPKCPAIALETVMEYGRAPEFELILRGGEVPGANVQGKMTNDHDGESPMALMALIESGAFTPVAKQMAEMNAAVQKAVVRNGDKALMAIIVVHGDSETQSIVEAVEHLEEEWTK